MIIKMWGEMNEVWNEQCFWGEMNVGRNDSEPYLQLWILRTFSKIYILRFLSHGLPESHNQIEADSN